VEKTRYHVPYGNHLWEIDIFSGDNEGLQMAEVELSAVDEAFELPSWIGDEVTEDKRYYNIYLLKHPYKQWS